jgi:hypothetical protein
VARRESQLRRLIDHLYWIFLSTVFVSDKKKSFVGPSSYHVRHTTTHLITEVKQRWARIVLGWVTTQMTSTRDALRMCARILWPGKASKKILRKVIPPCFCEKSQNAS